ncbi:MAG TPA: S8 family serine peptidase [Phycisphaerae bacterium]|nr:S8 family serine peptidase [Phycisphaerae bacterium]
MSSRVVFLASWLMGMAVLSSVAAGDVRWRNGSAPIPRRQPGQIGMAIEEITRGGGARHIVVQFDEPITDNDKTTLAAAGIRLLDFLGDNAFFASVDRSRLDAAALAAVPGFSRVTVVDPSWKLHPSLSIGEIPKWAIQAPEELDEGEAGSSREGPLPADPIVAVLVKFHPDVPLATEAVDICRQYGANVKSSLSLVNTLVIELPQSMLMMLVAEDAVEWMEPPLPALQEINAENRALTGANTVQAPPYSLTGAGVNVLIYDGGRVRTTHVDFQGRAVIGSAEATCSTISSHSTHVAGTVGGAGVANANNKGMAPGVNIISYGFDQDASGTGCPPLSQGFLYTNPGDLNHDYNAAINADGAHISNNSIGTNTAPNGYPCSWEGDYGVTDTLIDSIVRGGLGTPFRVIWANGNERQTSTCNDPNPNVPAGYHKTAPPACAKNHITVGATNANDDSMTSFSSWGPADDDRMKPDVSAPGCQAGGDGGVTSCTSTSDTSYGSSCGTSMASPTVCGLSALIMQDYRAHFGMATPFMRNSTLKILLAHTAVDRGNVGPDNQFGYGSVRVQPAIDFMRSNNYGNFLENQISQGGSYNTLVVVNPGDPVMKVTLAWDDVPGTPNVSPALVNDLDLVVFDPNNVQRFPWTLGGLANPSAPAVQTQANHVDNIEQVLVNAPIPGVYRVEVHGFNVPQGPQPFSICASPLLVNCSQQGLIALDRNQYTCTASATIRVVDCDLNTDDNVVETVNVTVDSTTEPGGETVLLTETGAQTAAFEGAISLDSTDSSGVLQVAHGDTVTATYTDADDGLGGINVVVTDTSAVDCQPPVISNVQTSNLGPHTATVTFTTDEAAQGTVRYGTSCTSLTQSVLESAFGTSHTLVLQGLLDDTQYFFAIDAVDPATNSATDDNAGGCYAFTTPEIPDSFTEEFTAGDFDLDDTSLLFTPNASIDFYSLCSTSISVLPTDPAGGTALTLADNANANVVLTGANQVSLYGVNYASFFIGSNGYITFTAGDTDSSPTVGDHFDTARISALFANLNPALGGTVSWKELADRAVVTWENVPEALTANTNTLQVEMFFDGRLRLSFLRVDLTDGITGLSGGGGIPPDYAEMDLSALAPSCGPQPPAAASRTIETPVSIATDITLVAGDDGVPGPLSYIITSLPLAPLEDVGNSYSITPGDLPYTLFGGGNQVRYHSGAAPTTDPFQFKVNDGGTPPTGGDSNLATITVQVQPVLALPFSDAFPTTTFDPAKWHLIDTATIDGVGIAEPSLPNSARLNADPNGSDEIRTHLINLANETAVRLIYFYQQAGGGESPDAGDDLFVEFYNNVGSWELVNQHFGSEPDMGTYQPVNVLLPASAFHPAFRLRFRTTGTSGAFDDWFVDDVSVTVASAPTASNSAVTAPFNGFLDITLIASDPNMDPLTYIIASLPSNGTIQDPGAGLADITTVPYTLAANGNLVRYVPDTGFGGLDPFTFMVNDGVNDSNVATVSVTVEPVLTLPFIDTFPTTTFDPGKWGFISNATIDGLGIAEPSEPSSARFNGDPAAGDEIRTYAIDLSSAGVARLTYYFECRGGGESPDSGDDLIIEYLDGFGVWRELQRHPGSLPDMTTYQQVDMQLPAGAMHSSFRLRIRNSGTSGAFDDWFVDNISLVVANAPTAVNGAVSTPSDTLVNITLVASDPNLDPLDYLITTLPTNGSLRDLNNGLIMVAPYALIGGGDGVRYTPNLGFSGNDGFQFKVSDGTHESNTATVTIAVGGAQPVHVFPLDSDPGWTADAGPGGGSGPNGGGWAFGTPTNTDPPCGTGRVDPPGGFTGATVYGYNLAGCYTNNLLFTRWLTTTAINCTSLSSVQLRYRRWLGVESANFDHANIQVSNDGVNWTTVWNHTATTAINDSTWSLQTYSLLGVADNQPTVFLRWGMGTTDGSVTYQGWNIDDIEILALAPSACSGGTYGDVNLDLAIDAGDAQKFTDVLLNPGGATAAEKCAADVHADGTIDDLDLEEFVELLLAQP